MRKLWKQGSAVLAVAAVVGVWCLSQSQAAKPPGGGGGGGGAVNPAWVIMDGDDISRLKLLSSNGLSQQEIVKARAFRGMKAPTWSPDGKWIAFLKGEDIGRSLRIIRPDGTGERVIFLFAGPGPEWIHGMQWVPGEVDRIVYQTFATNELYAISTLDQNPVPQLILPGTEMSWLSGVTLSPDLQPQTPGYQGAIAFVALIAGSTAYEPRLSVAFAEDGLSGLEVDASSIVQATTLSDGVATPSWSHDGLNIAFLYHNYSYPDWGNSLEVLPVRVDATGITLLENQVRTVYDSAPVGQYGPYHAVMHRPCWSPDDSLIGFCAQVGVEPDGSKPFDLFRARSDGTGVVNVTNGSMRPMFVDWNPKWTFDLK